MHALARAIGLILLGTYPAGLSAQVMSDPRPAASAHDAAPAGGTAAADADSSPLPLKPRATTGHAETGKRADELPSLTTVGGSLAAVLGIFFVIVWLLRRTAPNGLGTLPAEVFEVLGRAPLANHQQVHLLRCGNKLLLVSITAAGAGGGAKTLTEITDPAEIERLTDLCRHARPSGPTKTFRQMFCQVEDRNG